MTERVEELTEANNHLLKRLDKLKNAKSALLKELWPAHTNNANYSYFVATDGHTNRHNNAAS